MKLSAAVVLFLAATTSAFSPVSIPKSTNTHLKAQSNANDNLFAKAAAAACMTAFLWGSPTVMVEKMDSSNMVVPPAVIEQTMASAVEKASGSGSRVNKDADSLLRYALPIKNKEVRTPLHAPALALGWKEVDFEFWTPA
jgi:hypothetical protein